MGRTMQAVVHWWRSRVRVDQRGGNLVEYAMLAALIAVACMTAVAFFGNGVLSLFNTIGNALP